MNASELVKIETGTHLWQAQSIFGLIFKSKLVHYIGWRCAIYAKTVSCAHVSLTHAGFCIDGH